MRRTLLSFLTATMVCTSICGCSKAPVDQPVTTVVEQSLKSNVPQPVYTTICVDMATALPVMDNKITVTRRYTEKIDGFSDAVDYLDRMKVCCLNGDIEAGIAAAEARNKKINTLELEFEQIAFEDLFELSKIITSECGASWLSREWKMAVGEVVINRKNSPEFPDSIYDVIHAEGQYGNVDTSYYRSLIPFEDCVDVAASLLSGERVMNEPSVVFQSGVRQGSGVHLELYDSIFGYTYLCYSSYPELYGG